MGCNYYFVAPTCSHCNQPAEKLHIGTSKAGWVFALHVIPERDINTLEDWMEFVRLHFDWIIRDEYGTNITSAQMWSIIRDRSGSLSADVPPWAGETIQGLRRNTLDGEHCISHGEGTWDCIVGTFC